MHNCCPNVVKQSNEMKDRMYITHSSARGTANVMFLVVSHGIVQVTICLFISYDQYKAITGDSTGRKTKHYLM